MQLPLDVTLTECEKVYSSTMTPVRFEENELEIRVSGTCGNDFRYVFEKDKGRLCGINRDGTEFLARDSKFGIWRAPTDNDRNIKHQWGFWNYRQSTQKCYSFRVLEKAETYVTLLGTYAVGGPSAKPPVKFSVMYVVYGNGELGHALDQKSAHVAVVHERPPRREVIARLLRLDVREIVFADRHVVNARLSSALNGACAALNRLANATCKTRRPQKERSLILSIVKKLIDKLRCVITKGEDTEMLSYEYNHMNTKPKGEAQVLTEE